MAWCESTDVQLAYNSLFVTDLADDDKNATADTGVIARAIAMAMDEMFSYIGGRYPTITPEYTGTVPTFYKHVCSQLAAINLKRRQGMGAGEWHESIIALLEKVRDGKAIVQGWTSSSLPDSTTLEVCSEFGIRQLDEYGEPGVERMSDGDENDPNDG